MKLTSLDKLMQDQLKDLYSAETQLTKALPKMARCATSPQLRQAFLTHAEETKHHIERLERVAELLDMKATGKKCHAMEGLIEEGKEVLDAEGDPPLIDAALIAAAQRVEHYEMAGYGTARTMAQWLGNDEAARLLQETLDEEGETDKKLTAIAEEVYRNVPRLGDPATAETAEKARAR
jgi:ferritin-like metal-binding protein YciE